MADQRPNQPPRQNPSGNHERSDGELAAELTDAASVVGDKPRAKIPADMEAEIEKARILNVVTATIAGCSWGKNMSSPMRRAFADYCRRYDVDPVTEMDNLGGNVYVNADWYRRKLGELRLIGIVRDYVIEHIQADKRLDALRKDQTLPEDMRRIANEKWFSMMMRRISLNAPEEAEAIGVCTIWLAKGGSPIVGWKAAGNGTSVMQPKHGGGSSPNPVAENNAALFVETTCIRRAAMQLFSHLSGQRISVLPNIEDMTAEISTLGERIASIDAAIPPQEPEKPAQAVLTAGPGYDELAAFEASLRAKRGEPLSVVVESTRPSNDVLDRAINLPDPYADHQTVNLPDPPIDPCPPDPNDPTPFDPDTPKLAAVPIDYPLRPKPAPRPCMICQALVSGGYTSEHVETCVFYKADEAAVVVP